jgi:hypothetical protein
MACSKCKKKKLDLRSEIEKQTSFVSKGVIVFVIIWSVLAIYGLHSLISKVL